MAVLLHHSIDTFAEGKLPRVLEYFDLGKFGVFLFFALSGAVIPFALKSESRFAVRRFILGRILRLYPMYWVSLLLGVLFFNAVSHSVSDVLINVTMFQRFFGVPDVLGVYWTLQIEWVFYGVCVGLFLWKPKSWVDKAKLLSLTFLGVALILAVGRFVFEVKLPVAVPLALSVMFWGTLCRLAIMSGKRRDALWVGCVIVLVVFPISLLAYNQDYGNGERWYRYALPYCMAILAFFGGMFCVKLESGLLMFVGKVSYSIYLMHSFVIDCVGTVGVGWGLQTGMVACFTVLLATCTYYAIEKPACFLAMRLQEQMKAGDVVGVTEMDRSREL